jgi:hypothetical protein
MQQTETEIDRLKTIVDQIIENARSDIHTEIGPTGPKVHIWAL